MSWLVRFRPNNTEAHGRRPPGESASRGDLVEEYDLLVSQLWDLGTTGVFQEPHPDRLDQAALVAGFADQALAEAAMAIGADHGLTSSLDVPNTRWHSQEPSTVQLTTAMGPVSFSLVAGPAFGHGAHPTTAACLDLLIGLSQRRLSLGRVLDLGTGSGVLAIAAHRLGSDSITAIDSDPAAVAMAKANLSTNGVEALCSTDSVNELVNRGMQFDTVLVNVLVTVHEAVAPAVALALAPGGNVILSGVLSRQLERAVSAYRQHRPELSASVVAEHDDWRAAILADNKNG